MVGYSPWGCKESGTAEKLTLPRQARGPISGTKLGEKIGSMDAESKTERNQTRWSRKPKSSRHRVQGMGQGQPPGVKKGLTETRWDSLAGAGEAPTQPSWGGECEHHGHCPASICTLSSGELPLSQCTQSQQGLSLLSRVLEGLRTDEAHACSWGHVTVSDVTVPELCSFTSDPQMASSTFPSVKCLLKLAKVSLSCL